MKFTTNTLAAVSILAGVSVSSAQRALHRHVVSGKQQRLGLRALNEELQADESMSMSFPVADEIDQNFGTDTGGGKSGKVPKVNVPTSPFSPNICAGQYGRFLEQAGLVPDEITCPEARDGTGPFGRVAPQTGGDISCDPLGGIKQGMLNVSSLEAVPITEPLGTTSLCVANVHFHIGAEHNSDGEFDTQFNATNGPAEVGNVEGAETGKRCNFFQTGEDRDGNALNFDDYDFKHCVDVKVGETYEFHWPRSDLAACGQYNNQYQNPFTDGLLCQGGNPLFNETGSGLIGAITAGDGVNSGSQVLASNIGVQGQVFTVVNDEDFFYPNLIDGMLVDEERGLGQDVTVYLGSRTGDRFDDEAGGILPCDPISPVTWQVDRKCQLISASTMDKLCLDIKRRPGMRRCGTGVGEPCEFFLFHPEQLFVVDNEDDPEDGQTCCYPDTRPDGSRGVVNPALVSNDKRDLNDNCPTGWGK